MSDFKFDAIGTLWQIDFFSPVLDEKKSEILSCIQKRIDEFDKIYSRFRGDSLISQIATSKGEYVFPDDSKELFDLYYALYGETDGLFTPFVGQMLSDAGYDASYSLVQKKPLEIAPLWERVIEFDFPRLIVREPVLLDFGAAGKGYLVDIVSGIISSFGVSEYCIDAGGDMLHVGAKPTLVALENPQDFAQAIGTFSLQNQSLCGSAGNRRVWGEFTHIINPATLESPRNILGVWVSAKTTLLADAIATCLFFVSAKRLLRTHDFEYLVVYDDKSIEKSGGFSAEIFT